jgi:4-amino-4-deoxy-L-arabinose transferase-like glycosyltransferase
MPRLWRWWVVLLWAASLVLLFTHLGDAPLRDWDEGLVARVAEEISLKPFPSNLMPTLWGEPYLNKPPLLHGLIASAIQLWRGDAESEALRQVPPEWLVRAIPAFCSSLIVPLVAMVQWRLRPGDRWAAICSAAVALTLLPLMRHGRLAMLDGTLISAMALQWWALLSLPREPQAHQLRCWGVIAGLAGSLILLLKAPVSLPLLVGACLLLAWEQRWPLRRWLPLLTWIGVGLLPGLLWHGWHLLERGPEAITMWGGQGLARVVNAVEGHSGGLAVPVLEVLEGGWPWLALWPLGMLLALQQRQLRWGYWSLGLTALTAAAVLPLQTQLPWYSHLLWPAFALSVGPVFTELVERRGDVRSWGLRILPWVPCLWILAGAVLLAVQGRLGVPAMVTLPATGGLVLGGTLLLNPAVRLRRLGAAALVLLLWGALLALFSTPIWLWELQETWAVQPVVGWVRTLPPADQSLALVLPGDQRPSLDWYLGRELVAGARARRLLRNSPKPLLVLSEQNPSRPHLSCRVVQKAPQPQPEGPALFRCTPTSA